MPHIHDKVDFCVEVFILYKGRVLLRRHDKYRVLLSVGGHIELDEDPNQAAVREVKEEVGLDITLLHVTPYRIVNDVHHTGLVPPVFVNRHRMTDTHDHVVLVYFATSATDRLVLSQREKTDECRWFTRAELDDPRLDIPEHVKSYARAALDMATARVRTAA